MMIPRMRRVAVNLLFLLATALCVLLLPFVLTADAAAEPDGSEFKKQALVMDMADDYIAALGESVYLLTRSDKITAKSRWLAQSFLRNGVGAALDVAVSPNPSVSLLDLLVLTSLQAWSFEMHWIPAGIGKEGLPALERLKRAEEDAWTSARDTLSKNQLRTLRELIDAWIAENPDRTVVALVRFNEFVDERKISSLSLRGKARGLLKAVSEASAAVDEVRLLGERLLWFAGRYPYLLGEQTELTAYRLIDQPEGAALMAAVKSLQRLSDSLTNRIGTIQNDLEHQQAVFFTKISSERKAAIIQFQTALAAIVEQAIDDAAEGITAQRTEAITQFFDRFTEERKLLFEDLMSRQEDLLGIMTELKETISVSGTLANNLTGTVNAIDRVVSHFDTEPGDDREPLRMVDVRDAAIEIGRAADQMTVTIERAVELIESKALDKRMRVIADPANAIIDQIFWRAVILIAVLVAGLGFLRLLPQRRTKIINNDV